MLALYLARLFPAPLSSRWTSTLILRPSLSVATISSLTERFRRFATNTWVWTSRTTKSGLFRMIRKTNCVDSVSSSKHLVRNTSSMSRKRLIRSKSSWRTQDSCSAIAKTTTAFPLSLSYHKEGGLSSPADSLKAMGKQRKPLANRPQTRKSPSVTIGA